MLDFTKVNIETTFDIYPIDIKELSVGNVVVLYDSDYPADSVDDRLIGAIENAYMLSKYHPFMRAMEMDEYFMEYFGFRKIVCPDKDGDYGSEGQMEWIKPLNRFGHYLTYDTFEILEFCGSCQQLRLMEYSGKIDDNNLFDINKIKRIITLKDNLRVHQLQNIYRLLSGEELIFDDWHFQRGRPIMNGGEFPPVDKNTFESFVEARKLRQFPMYDLVGNDERWMYVDENNILVGVFIKEWNVWSGKGKNKYYINKLYTN